MMARDAVLVVGGTGAFGSRLVDGILATTEHRVVIGGRDLGRAQAAAARCNAAWPGQRVTAMGIDTARPDGAALASCGAGVAIDAAGPFGATRYGFAAAVLAAGMDYIDLADSRRFVAGFAAALDGAARAGGRVALTGASSTPALSTAALDALTAGWRRVDEVVVAIAPGNRAPRGLSVVRSILAGAGQPVRLLLDGRWVERPGWGLTQRRAMPGIGRRWVSLVDTPDLDIMPDRWGVRGSVVFLAGLELSVLHLGLLAASLPVRLGVVGSLETLSRPARAAAALLESLGSDRGGMEVTAGGRDAEDRPVQASWWLVAEAGRGPVVPTLPALAALRRMARGDVEPGARPCVGVLALDAIEGEMRRHRIMTGKAGGSAAGSKSATVPPSSGGVRGYKVGRAHCETTEIRSPAADDQP